MNTRFLKELYEKLPESVKMLSAPIIRNGMIKNKMFLEQHSELIRADEMSDSEVTALQFDKLKKTCIFAYENTQYYHKLFDQVGFDCFKFDSFSEFSHKVPVLTKDEVLAYYDEINVQSIHGDYPASTGGSSGKRLVINNAQECFYRENAFLCHHYLKFGDYDFRKSKVAYFGGLGSTIISASPLYNMMRYNSKLINRGTVAQVIKSLNSFKPDYIQGLPSAIYFFCKLLDESKDKLAFKVKGVIFASENIYSNQRRYIERVLGCRSLAHYGHTERVVFAEEHFSDDEKPQYSFNKLYGYTEIDAKDGTIIGTGFINPKMPLIRYQTDDCAEELGNGLYHIEGHRTAAMVGKNGERISAASFAHMDEIFDIIEKFQFVQDEPGVIRIDLIPKSQLTDSDITEIRKSLDKKFMGNMSVKINVVDEIKLTTRGKYALLIQNIKDE